MVKTKLQSTTRGVKKTAKVKVKPKAKRKPRVKEEFRLSHEDISKAVASLLYMSIRHEAAINQIEEFLSGGQEEEPKPKSKSKSKLN